MTGNQERQKPITMEDMAKLAGVHSRTVADALKGTGRVAPATREKVLRIARELNYVPNAAARALATGRTGKVAVLSGPLRENYYANVVHLLEAHLGAGGYELVLLDSGREVRELENATKTSKVDGVIVVGITERTDEYLRSTPTVQPRVLIDTSQPDYIDHITLDLRPAVEAALHLMLNAGRQRIAYVVNNRDEWADQEVRMRTYLDVMHQAGRTPEILDVDSTLSSEERIQSLLQYIAEHGCPDAIMCQNDETAIYTYHAVLKNGYRIPNDTLLSGCDGLPYMEYLDTPLSTIAFPMTEICQIASKFLQKRMESPNIPLQRQTLQGKLIVRKSLMPNSGE